MGQIVIMPCVTIYNHPKWMMGISFDFKNLNNHAIWQIGIVPLVMI
jgi:hypothetical protein